MTGGTDGNVLVRGLSAAEVVLVEELGQQGLDAAQGLVLAVKQHHQVRHGERLAHQHQQLPKEPWEPQFHRQDRKESYKSHNQREMNRGV